MLPSIYIVTEEEVVCIGRELTVFEESKKIGVLSMYVTWDGGEGGERECRKEVREGESEGGREQERKMMGEERQRGRT